MNNVIEALVYAKEYLKLTYPHVRLNKEKYQTIELHRQLNYLLCGYIDSTVIAFGEVTRKDIANFIEAWIAAQGTLKPERPIVIRDE